MPFAFDLFDELPRTLGDVQKGALSKAAGALARRAYGLVCEHDKGLRTPLTPFFNIPYSDSFLPRVCSRDSDMVL